MLRPGRAALEYGAITKGGIAMAPDLKAQDVSAQEAGSLLESMQIDDLEPDERSREEITGGCADGHHIAADGTLVD